jgi:hypothetical protein
LLYLMAAQGLPKGAVPSHKFQTLSCITVSASQLQFENANPAYLSTLEDKGIFGGRKKGTSKGALDPTSHTLAAWIQLQATE